MPEGDTGVEQGEALDGFIGALLDDDAEALYERAPCGYLSTTPDGLIIKVNETFLRWTGYERAAVVGHARFTDLLTAGGRIYHETHYAPMLRMQGQAREIALDIVASDGRRLPALVNAVVVDGDDGAPLVVRAAVFDATHRREYERELLRAKQRAEESEERARVLARTLQQMLLPPADPVVPGLDVASAYRPARAGDEVGGDFYDIFEIGAGDWVVALGDVEGKGVDAAVVTTLVRDALRTAAVRTPRADDMLATANQVLLRHPTERFCTVVLVRLREAEDGWTATVARAGHPAPLLRAADGTVTERGPLGPLLGVFDEPAFADEEVPLRPGDALLLFTDGVTEGQRADGELFGDGRLARAAEAAGQGAGPLVEQVLAQVTAFQGEQPRDDIALVAIAHP